jgi:2-polyprenyl-3-methyl-5-hydroxy-6-metoxy-1,4-benzoquinol methylase
MDLRELPTHAFARHPWETARARFFLRLLRQHLQGMALSIVDFGAGDGFFARSLLDAWPVVAKVACFDQAYRPETMPVAADRRISFTRQRPKEPSDVLLLLDVLEHDTDDQGTLHGALADCLRPGGWVLVSVPAHPILFSRHDELLGHKRRYSAGALRALAKAEGLAIVEEGQLFTSLLVPRALAKLVEMVRPRKPEVGAQAEQVDTPLGTWNHGAMLTRAVEALLGLDAAVARQLAGRKLAVPGLSTWLLARKP